jgi:hypothetical protein
LGTGNSVSLRVKDTASATAFSSITNREDRERCCVQSESKVFGVRSKF